MIINITAITADISIYRYRKLERCIIYADRV